MYDVRDIVISYLIAGLLIVLIGAIPADRAGEQDIHVVDPSIPAWPVTLHEMVSTDETIDPFEESMRRSDLSEKNRDLILSADARGRSERIALALLARGAVCAPSTVRTN